MSHFFCITSHQILSVTFTFLVLRKFFVINWRVGKVKHEENHERCSILVHICTMLHGQEGANM
eukprot:m.98471 g.98471  ORF g.98471 m.98471 type:complete len:63 (+) comp13638_c0_seq1:732-920(+)